MGVSRAWYCFARLEEVWEALVYERVKEDYQWKGSWFKTALWHKKMKNYQELEMNVPIYSDLLYYSWYYNQVDMTPWLGDNIKRESGLSYPNFLQNYEKSYTPVIFTDVVKQWPAFNLWTRANMTDKFLSIINGCTTAKAHHWTKWQNRFTHLEHFNKKKPFYAFKDPATGLPVQTSPSGFYTVPPYFPEDHFSVLGPERPDYAWLLVGCARSGSTWHQDPDMTSAWNGVLYGRKKFVLFPGDQLPPGVEKNGDNVIPPRTVIQWFVEYYDTLQKGEFYECVLHPGEMLFIPSGWWHTVLNVDETIAITQNYVSGTNLPIVFDYLKHENKLTFGKFEEKLKVHRPDLLAPLLAKTNSSQWEDFVSKEEEWFLSF
eukprot:TRINITY_DN2323_c0_g1_i1.p1 TRINITY_DN2323_c0_g1~~TRINITY_DN2323_c0_g1_i1.p1  ORF type:complete len:389 (-),score=86.84 TRINITY_DN2323_c0_g1_i1:41-1162(-)